MKKILIALMLLLTSSAYAHDDGGFYVIPTIKKVEVCNGTPVGNNAFKFDAPHKLFVGSVLSTPAGFLVEITGIKLDYWSTRSFLNYVSYTAHDYFHVAPNTLPQPDKGVKGHYYYFANGDIAYARYL